MRMVRLDPSYTWSVNFESSESLCVMRFLREYAENLRKSVFS